MSMAMSMLEKGFDGVLPDLDISDLEKFDLMKTVISDCYLPLNYCPLDLA